MPPHLRRKTGAESAMSLTAMAITELAVIGPEEEKVAALKSTASRQSIAIRSALETKTVAKTTFVDLPTDEERAKMDAEDRVKRSSKTLAFRQFPVQPVTDDIATIAPKIKCKYCFAVKPWQEFHEKRLKAVMAKVGTRIRATIFVDPAETVRHTRIRCKTCTPSPADEKECGDCGKWKGRTAFKKVQFKRDDGYCERCRKQRGEENDDGSGLSVESTSDFEDEEDSGTTMGGPSDGGVSLD